MAKKYTKEMLEDLVSRHDNIKACLNEIGNTLDGNNYTYFHKQIKLNNVDISHFKNANEVRQQKRLERGGSWRYPAPFDEVFCLDSKWKYSGNSLKKRLYDAGLKQPICELCGQDENWKTGKISLILDHIDGNHFDNRVENLRIVCPNCDASSDTFKARNKNSHKKKIIEKKIKAQEKLIQKDILFETNKQFWNNILINNNLTIKDYGLGSKLSAITNLSPQFCLKCISKYVKLSNI